MTSEQFAYWMQGFVELNGETPTAEQWQSIKDHLKTVFAKVTPQIGVQPAPMPERPNYYIPNPLHQPLITC